MARITYLHLGEHGSYMNSGFDYEYCFDGEKAGIKVRTDGVSEEDAVVTDVDGKFSRRLEAVIEDMKVRKWDGFSGSNKFVLDGDSFSFSARFDDGKSISAYGYMKHPKNYAEVKSALQGLFGEYCREAAN